MNAKHDLQGSFHSRTQTVRTPLYVSGGFDGAQRFLLPDEMDIEGAGDLTVCRAKDGRSFHRDFIHSEEDSALRESRDRHDRLRRALAEANILAAFSVTREPDRIAHGMSRLELEAKAEEDQRRYRNWVSTLETQWSRATGKKPGNRELIDSLKALPAIASALSHIDSTDFMIVLEARARKELKEVRAS